MDLVAPVATIRDLGEYTFVLVVVRLAGEPIGTVRVPVHGDRCPGRVVAEAIAAELGPALLRQRLLALLASAPAARRLDIESAVSALPLDETGDDGSTPSITVAVCTRDRPEELDRCLAALRRQRHRARVVVVDNAPSSAAAARLLAERYPQFEYVVEPRPGLDHARNRAIAETSSDVLAFTDDDVVVDERWTGALARAFKEEPGLGAVTGLVLPFEIETPAQELFERLGGFGRGFFRRWETACVTSGRRRRAGEILGAGQFGTGANMAFRCSVFDRVGGFDPALGAGTPSRGGDDLEMFHRLLSYGEMLRYEPAAIAFHQHRRTLAELESQLRDNGAQWAMMTAARAGGRATVADVRTVIGWYVTTRWPRLVLESLQIPNRLPPRLPLAEVRGMLAAAVTGTYRRSRVVNPDRPVPPIPTPGPADEPCSRTDPRTEVATIDVQGPISLNEIPRGTSAISVLVTRGPAAIGRLEVDTDGRPLCDRQLRELVVDELGARILGECEFRDHEQVQQEVAFRLAGALRRDAETDPERRVYAASIVIATLDRPDSLQQCLQSLGRHRSRHDVEIVVVDNNPGSGLTATVLEQYPEVVRVSENRRGLAYARNAGLLSATGEIVVTTDDDVQVPEGWLDLLLEPFERNDVMAVCGNIQPLELRNSVQLDFERTGALSKGFLRQESRWEHPRSSWRAFPAWELGATANAAFRAEIFSHPEIGLMDEALGAGMPSGVGEDSYLVYRIVRAGYTVVYEPSAFVYHRHRDTTEALIKQLTAYYSGHVAHNLTTLVRDRDPRAIERIARVAAYVVVARVQSLVGRGPVSSLSARAQLRGVARGPANYLRSQRRVRRDGRSRPAPAQKG